MPYIVNIQKIKIKLEDSEINKISCKFAAHTIAQPLYEIQNLKEKISKVK